MPRRGYMSVTSKEPNPSWPVGAQHDYLDICVLTVKGCLHRRHGPGSNQVVFLRCFIYLASFPNPETPSKYKIHLPEEEVMTGLVSSRHSRSDRWQISIATDKLLFYKENFKESHIESEYAIQAEACKVEFIITFVIDQGHV